MILLCLNKRSSQRNFRIEARYKTLFAEIEVYLWLKSEKQWELEMPKHFTFDFKVRNKKVYIEVKRGYNDLTSNQVWQLYHYINEIDKFYVATDKKHAESEGFKLVESFETIFGEFFFHKIDVNTYFVFIIDFSLLLEIDFIKAVIRLLLVGKI